MPQQQLQWLDTFVSNIDIIDEQHQQIMLQINALGEAATTRDREKAGAALNELVSATINHFELEEELMAESGYGHLKAHKLLHDRFVEKLVTFTHRFDCGECISTEIHPYLKGWFIQHIDEDRDYSDSLAEEMNASKKARKSWFARAFG